MVRLARQHKFRARRARADGIEFDSMKERDRYLELKLLQRAGHISSLELQPVYRLGTADNPIKIRSRGYPNGRRIQYRADFRYYDHRIDQVVVEDVKGFDTPASRIKRAVVEWQYGIDIVVL